VTSCVALLQELKARLDCFVLRAAAVPQLLRDTPEGEEEEMGEEEEQPPSETPLEDADYEELLRTLGNRGVVGAKYKWRRSRWQGLCPVALSEGRLAQGKTQCAVG
jgi:hypothetical protein